MNNILIKIRTSYEDFSGVDRKIAEWILENELNSAKFSVSEIAKSCGTSKTAVVRFCKGIGLSGFKELKMHLVSEAIDAKRGDDRSVETCFDILGNEDVETIVHRVTHNSVLAIQETGKLIDPGTLERAITLLDEARRIDFYGVGASALVAIDAQQKFMRIGKTCNTSQDADVQITLACSLEPEDVAVAVSYSGATETVLRAAAIAKESGARLIGITKYSANNRLAELCDVVLYTSSPEVLMRSGATSSRIAQLMIVDLLFVGVASMRFDKYQGILEKSYRAANKNRA